MDDGVDFNCQFVSSHLGISRSAADNVRVVLCKGVGTHGADVVTEGVSVHDADTANQGGITV